MSVQPRKCQCKRIIDRLVSCLKTSLSVREVWGSVSGLVRLDTMSCTDRYCCSAALELVVLLRRSAEKM